jgi:hypothetical protein
MSPGKRCVHVCLDSTKKVVPRGSTIIMEDGSGKMLKLLFTLCLFFSSLEAGLLVGVGESEITPPNGTPSAGYHAPQRHMEGAHDPLLAIALVIDTEEKQFALCAVDHLGFDHRMVEEIKAQFPRMEIIIASSHTHSGAGAYLDMPVIGEMLAGPYDPKIRDMLICQTAKAIKVAAENLQEAKLGIGYGKVHGVNTFRSSWPKDHQSPEELTVIQFVSKENKNLAVLFNFAMHPTVLSKKNKFYSADFVGYAREKIQKELGGSALFFNSAQADVGPKVTSNEEYQNCQRLGEVLADAVITLARTLSFQAECTLNMLHYPYTLEVKPTSSGLKLPVDTYRSELNVLVFNQSDAFVTVPGELSCLYLEQIAAQSPFNHTSVFGLANDAHGYILTPEAFHQKTYESTLSFGGPNYGDWMVMQLIFLLHLTNTK